MKGQTVENRKAHRFKEPIVGRSFGLLRFLP